MAKAKSGVALLPALLPRNVDFRENRSALKITKNNVSRLPIRTTQLITLAHSSTLNRLTLSVTRRGWFSWKTSTTEHVAIGMLGKSMLDAGHGAFRNIVKYVCWKRDKFFAEVNSRGTSAAWLK